jgi:hypothetical protein
MVFQVLAINPGSTSTKIAWFYDEEEQWRETVRHDPEELARFEAIADQFEFRLATIQAAAGSSVKRGHRSSTWMFPRLASSRTICRVVPERARLVGAVMRCPFFIRKKVLWDPSTISPSGQ